LDVGEEHQKSVEKLIQLSERYCVVLQTIKQGVNVETKLSQAGESVQDTSTDGQAHKNVNGNSK